MEMRPVSENAEVTAGTGEKYVWTLWKVFLMSHTLNLESLPVVTMYLPHLEVAKDVTGAEGWVNILTTGVDPIFGVHIVTSPVLWPTQITPFYAFCIIAVGSPFLVFISLITCPMDTSKYFKCPNLEALTSRK